MIGCMSKRSSKNNNSDFPEPHADIRMPKSSYELDLHIWEKNRETKTHSVLHSTKERVRLNYRDSVDGVHQTKIDNSYIDTFALKVERGRKNILNAELYIFRNEVWQKLVETKIKVIDIATVEKGNPLREIAIGQYLKSIYCKKQDSNMEDTLEATYNHGILLHYDVFVCNETIVIMMPAFSKDFLDVFYNRPPFDVNFVRQCFNKALIGLQSIQNANVCHHDISLENFVIDDEGNVAIIDFGLSFEIPYSHGNRCFISRRGFEGGKVRLTR